MKAIRYIRNVFNAVFRPSALTTAQEELLREIYGGGVTSSGISVNYDTAMNLITVHSCVKILSETVKQLPLHLYKREGQKREKAEDHPLYSLLHDAPNSWMTSSEFWGMAQTHISLRGNFYAYKAMIGDKLKELIPLNPDSIVKIEQQTDYSLKYQVKDVWGNIRELDGSKIFHLKGLLLDKSYMGLNPIQYIREALGIPLAGEKFVARYFGKGMHPGAVIKHPLNLSVKAHSDLREALKKKYAGLGSTHDLMLIDEGMDISFPEVKLVDAQFLEQMKFSESQIAGFFRVPLMLLQTGDKTPTYASSEQFMLSFVIHTMMPILVNIERGISKSLLTNEERKIYYPKFSVNALLRGSMKERADFYKEMVNAEIMNPNECRALEDLNPYDGGDEYRTRTSTVREPKK